MYIYVYIHTYSKRDKDHACMTRPIQRHSHVAWIIYTCVSDVADTCATANQRAWHVQWDMSHSYVAWLIFTCIYYTLRGTHGYQEASVTWFMYMFTCVGFIRDVTDSRAAGNEQHSTFGWVMLYMHDSCHMWMSCFACNRVISYVYIHINVKSWNTFIYYRPTSKRRGLGNRRASGEGGTHEDVLVSQNKMHFGVAIFLYY